MINEKDLQITTFRSGSPLAFMRIIHSPTGIMVSGEDITYYGLKKRLIGELEVKINEQ